MASALEKLVLLMRPPAQPVDPGTETQWAAAEAELGTPLPEDYKAFIKIYGSGTIDDFLTVRNAVSSNPVVRLHDRARKAIASDNYLKERHPAVYWWPLFPEVGGWLPWGGTPDDHRFYWVTSGPPSAWKTALATREAETQIFDESLTSLLEGLLSRRIKTDLLGSYFPPAGECVFAP